ncbi:MAG: N-acetyltransferase [Chloroflexi bacterium]|nr:N-acetyltransferase [Chloroflexota bacterium]
MIEIRPECSSDIPAIHSVNAAAFERDSEAHLVDQLRDHGGLALSMVCVQDGQVIGHIAYSPVMIEFDDGGSLPALALAPVAILPEHQNSGIGTHLIQVSLDILKAQGHHLVIVLGHPDYYPRFGFKPASGFNIRSPYNVPDEAFMLLELTAGTLDNRPGVARYRPEFDGV